MKWNLLKTHPTTGIKDIPACYYYSITLKSLARCIEKMMQTKHIHQSSRHRKNLQCNYIEFVTPQKPKRSDGSTIMCYKATSTNQKNYNMFKIAIMTHGIIHIASITFIY